MKQDYPLGTGNPEDGCQRVTYSYDTNPVNPTFSQNSYGRLTAVQYGMPASAWYMASSFCASGGWMTYLTVPGTNYATNNFVEMYSYHPAGAVTAKQAALTRTWAPTAGGTVSRGVDVEVDYTYDQAGRPATVAYPMAGAGTPLAPPNGYTPMTLTYGYDTMGRPNALTDVSGATVSGVTVAGLNWPSGTPVNWAQNVQYDYAGRMTLMQYLEGLYPYSGTLIEGSIQQSMTYNVNGQLGTIGFAGGVSGTGIAPPTSMIQYTYSATQNNGQITQAVDTVTFGGETIVYQYDALKRLTSASSTPVYPLGPPAAYTQTFQYDGFGNLTGKTLNGTTTPIGVNAANNRLSSASYDLNGNMTSGSGATLTYDEANRVSSAAEVSGGAEFYGYTADNKRYYKYTSAGTEQLTFYGAHGEKLGVYSLGVNPGTFTLWINPASTNIWFAGKLILESNTPPMMDRLGTNRAGYAEFYPYGDEITSTANDHEKFATYTRDGYTGFDYADQRYYASTYGRFNTPDPHGGSAKVGDPGSQNRYAYVNGDPVNRYDPRGLCGGVPQPNRRFGTDDQGFDDCDEGGDGGDWSCGPGWVTDASLSGPCAGGGWGGGGAGEPARAMVSRINKPKHRMPPLVRSRNRIAGSCLR